MVSVQTLNHKLVLECRKCGRGDLHQHREHSFYRHQQVDCHSNSPTVHQSEDDIFLNESLAAACSPQKESLARRERATSKERLERETGGSAEEVKADRHSRSEATAGKFRFERNIFQPFPASPLVLVKKVKSRLASLQPNLFLAWTRHSYSDSGSSPEMR